MSQVDKNRVTLEVLSGDRPKRRIEIPRYIVYTVLFAAFVGAIASPFAMASYVHLLWRLNELQGENERLSRELQGRTARLGIATEAIASNFSTLEQEFEKLTMRHTVKKIAGIESQVDTLSTQVNSLQQIISPRNASEILTVARMREEILARAELEGRLDARTLGFEQRLNRTEDRLENIQYWIWGALVTIIGGLITVTVVVGRRLAPVLRTVAEGSTGSG